MRARTLYIESGSSWENGYVESYNGKLRNELLDREVFYTLLKVQVLTEQHRQTYNRIRPHSSLGYRPPAPETILSSDLVPAMGRLTIERGTTVGGRSLSRGVLLIYLPYIEAHSRIAALL